VHGRARAKRSGLIRPAGLADIDAALAMFEWLFEPPGYRPKR
jgi:hypothetical protein